MFNWNIKQKPILSLLGFGGGGSGNALRRRAGGLSATGGIITTPGNGYTYHTFLHPIHPASGQPDAGASGPPAPNGLDPYPFTFVVESGETNVELLCIGGGGFGNGCGGGGGGAGALIYQNSIAVTPQTYAITVAAGGKRNYYNPGQPQPYYYQNWTSSALGYTANGGGPGGGHTYDPAFVDGQSGASGGGDAGNRNGGGYGGNLGPGTSAPGGTPGSVSPPVGWGNPGGKGPDNNNGPGGGGGGAGGAGSGSSNGGGLAYPDFAGPLIGVSPIPSTYCPGGSGDGGQSSSVAINPAEGTGAGGRSGPYCQGGMGGATGLVVIRYLV